MASSTVQLTTKIQKSKLLNENKEILTLLMSFFTEVLQEKKSIAVELQQQVDTLEKKVDKLEASIDQTSQYERRDTIVLSGPSIPNITQGENCKTIARDLFWQHLRMNIEENDISTAHRIGRQQNENSDKRNIILKLCRRDQVRDIFVNCKTMRPPFYVNDSLIPTPTRNKICYVLRQLKKKYPSKIKGCSSFNGVPRVLLQEQGPTTRHRSSSRNGNQSINIATKLELEQFIHDHLDTTLNELSLSW